MRVFLADLDGTLVDSNHIFWDAKAELGRRALATAGVSRDVMRTWLEQATNEDFARGHTLPSQFGARLARAYRLAVLSVGATPCDEDLRWCAAQGAVVATAVYPPFPGVHAFLATVRSAGVRIGLVTKGSDAALQRRKIADATLADLVDDVLVVRIKTAQSWADARARLGAGGPITPGNTVIVGDSVRDDVGPAQQLGATAVWVAPPAHFWEHDRTPPLIPPHLTVPSVVDLTSWLPRWTAAPPMVGRGRSGAGHS